MFAPTRGRLTLSWAASYYYSPSSSSLSSSSSVLARPSSASLSLTLPLAAFHSTQWHTNRYSTLKTHRDEWSHKHTTTSGLIAHRLPIVIPGTASLHSRISLSASPFLDHPIDLTPALIQGYADRKARPVSLKDMLSMGSRPSYLLTAAQWLWSELPVRLAKRLRDLEDLPFGLTQSVEVQQLLQLYRESLQDALSIKSPQCTADELAFTEVIKSILTRHQQVVVDLASGVNGGFARSRSCVLTGQGGAGLGFSSRPSNQLFLLQELLDRFNAARIGLRMLMAQHVALHTPQPGMVGVIDLECNPSKIIEVAISDAASACSTAYGYTLVPKVEITDVASSKNGGIGVKPFAYVSAHLRFMVFELLKNAMRATVEHALRKKAMAGGWKGPDSNEPFPNHIELTSQDLPPIRVVIVDGQTDVILKISDQGGGIKRSHLPLVFSYTYNATQKSLSAAQQAAQLKKAQQTHQQMVEAAAQQKEKMTPNETSGGEEQAPSASSSSSTSSSSSFVSFSSSSVSPPGPNDWMTGANYQPTLDTSRHNFVEAFGLPITRLYSRHFGGDLQLHSLNGYGTDAYLYINRIGDMPEQLQD